MLSRYDSTVKVSVLCLLLVVVLPSFLPAASKDLGGGFTDHGVAVPISNHRGTVATVDGSGRNVVLIWAMDHRGCYELLLIDAETGKSEEFPLPFANTKADSPYASILSSGNRFYTHFGDHFVEFDPVKRAFTFTTATTPQMGMGMTEDDSGVIWSVAYPQSAVVSFNPKTREFRDYKNVYTQNWPQYQRFVAADDAGWIYFALGETASQIVALDPVSGKATPMLAENERVKKSAYVYRNLDGKVYGQAHRDPAGDWWQFHKGTRTKIGKHDTIRKKPIVTDSQQLFHSSFPDGKSLLSCNMTERQLVVLDPVSSTTKQLPFDYSSEGAHVMSVAVSPDGTVCGGCAFPMRFFSLDTKTDKLINRPGYDQWNAVMRHQDKYYIAGYPGGVLMEWDPAKAWINTDPKLPATNPQHLARVSPTVYRPTKLLACCGGSTIIMAGTPDYGYTGGGLLFHDRQTSSQVVLKDTDIIPDQSTLSLLELPDGRLLGGTTTTPGTGGEKKTTEAQLYIMDATSRKIEWHAAALPGVESYNDLCTTSKGLVYGFADRKIFFVFDPVKREMVSQKNVESELGLTSSQQGPRVFITGPGDDLYALFIKGVVSIDRKTHELKLLAKSPVAGQVGGDYLEERVYFAHGSHLYSCKVR